MLTDKIADIASLPDASSRVTKLKALLGPAVADNDDVTLRAIIDAALDEGPGTGIGTAVSKPVIDAFASVAGDITSNAALLSACSHCIARLAPPRMQPAFEHADFLVRWALFTVHVADEDFLRAAVVLSGARLESDSLSVDEKARGCVKAALYFLRAEDDVGADRVLKRGGDAVHRCSDATLTLQYKSCYAQLLDLKRRFVEAALRYSELLEAVSPQQPPQLQPPQDAPAPPAAAAASIVVPLAEQVAILAKACVCAVLAPAGPARQRIMGALARDPRLGGVPAPVRALLVRMCRRQFVAPGDAAAFEAGLQAHQRATLSDGTSIVQRALQEHNVLAAAAVYRSVGLGTLAARLGLGAGAAAEARAEAVAARMIAEGRVAGSIDQVDGMVDFEPPRAVGPLGSPLSDAAMTDGPHPTDCAVAALATAGGGAEARAAGCGGGGVATPPSATALLAWDAALKRACMAVKGAADAVGAAHPQFLPA